MTLEQLARESGVLKSDGVTPCVQPSGDSNAQRLVHLLTRASDEGSDAGACVVHPFGRETTTASFAMYTFSVAVFVQALTLVSFSPFADYGMPVRVSVGLHLLMRWTQELTASASL